MGKLIKWLKGFLPFKDNYKYLADKMTDLGYPVNTFNNTDEECIADDFARAVKEYNSVNAVSVFDPEEIKKALENPPITTFN